MQDKKTLVTRREILGALTGAAGAAVVACGSSPTAASSINNGASGTTTTGGTTSGSCSVINPETEGPYPDRTGMINNAAFYRQDITEGRPGTPLTLR